MTNWIKISDTAPEAADYDIRFCIWVSGIYENTGRRFVNLVTAAEFSDLESRSNAIDYWAHTELETPEPPDIDAHQY